MGRLVMVAMVVACAPKAAPAVKPAPAPEVLPVCGPTQADVWADLRARMQSDPVRVVRELGVSDRDFDKLARQLIIAWKHDEPAAVYTPPPPPIPRRDPDEEGRWWCFKMPDWGDCDRTRAACESARSTLTARRCEFPPNGLSKSDCQQVAANAAAIGECERQPRVACFGKHFVLDKHDDWTCTPSISTCKARRASVVANMSDDIKVTSECTAIE